KVLAGGQSLIPLMKLRLVRPTLVVDINPIMELRYVREESNGWLAIGALTRIADLVTSPIIRKKYHIIYEAAKQIADPQVRNMGTVGGNVSHGDPGNDLPAVFMALDARYVIRSPKGQRTVSPKDFYRGPYETILEPNELLTEVRIPPAKGRSGGSYAKLEKRVGDFAIAAVAVQVSLTEDGRISTAGLGYTNLAPKPLDGDPIATLLVGKKLSKDVLGEVKEALEKFGFSPSTDLRGPDWYKRDMAKNLTIKALNTAVERAEAMVV
ncbi:MAG: xanthine dehydrogenase family protein subunit M, partial [Thermoprotei archaeon]